MARKKNTAVASPCPDDDSFGPTPKKKRARKPNPVESVVIAGAILSEVVRDAIARITAKSGRTPTAYQIAVFKFALEGTGHAVVNSVAGSGKTTTVMDMCLALTHGLRQPSILLLAFGKKIADELNARNTLANVKARTCNSLGAGMLFGFAKAKGFTPRLLTRQGEKTEGTIHEYVSYDTLPLSKQAQIDNSIFIFSKLTDLFKGFGFGAIRELPTRDDVYSLCDRFGIDLPDPEEIDTDWFFDILLESYKRNINNYTVIDFSDQLLIPVRENLPFPRYDFVAVDESQDLNPIQIEMIRRLAARGARVIFVGDPCQAIYGFRGADPESIATVSRVFNATHLTLSICWRCCRKVVEQAKLIVPHIEPAPNAKDGIVDNIKEDDLYEKADDGDMVLCRTTAPLAEHCMALVRAGKKATILGSDIGKGLISLVNKIEKSTKKDGGSILDRVNTWGEKEIGKLRKNPKKNDSKIQRLQDRIDTVMVLIEECETFDCVREKIRSIFSDDAKGIILSTVHKAKGLEAERVFIIHPELLPHPMAKKDWQLEQENNLIYVAITRAMSELYWVEPKRPIKFGRNKDAA